MAFQVGVYESFIPFHVDVNFRRSLFMVPPSSETEHTVPGGQLADRYDGAPQLAGDPRPDDPDADVSVYVPAVWLL